MKRLSTFRTGRKGRVALALGAVAVTGVTVLSGSAAANAASTPAPKPAAHTTGKTTAVVVDCDPGHATVRQAERVPAHPSTDAPTVIAVNCASNQPNGPHSIPQDPRTSSGPNQPSLVEVPGAPAGVSSVRIEKPTAVEAVPQPIGQGRTTARR